MKKIKNIFALCVAIMFIDGSQAFGQISIAIPSGIDALARSMLQASESVAFNIQEQEIETAAENLLLTIRYENGDAVFCENQFINLTEVKTFENAILKNPKNYDQAWTNVTTRGVLFNVAETFARIKEANSSASLEYYYQALIGLMNNICSIDDIGVYCDEKSFFTE
ncbi:MAG: hypothetical protein KDD48_04665 [Bdellovibrionales bacterium]|nr:hypothetical protein [Bdellovibrionales bacterium]